MVVGHSQFRDRNSPQPSRRSARKCRRAARGRASIRMAASRTTLTPKLTASIRIAQPGLAVTTTTPANAGPAMPAAAVPTCWSWLARCRCSGLTTDGTSAVDAGRNAAAAAPCTKASRPITCTEGRPVSRRIPRTASAAPRTPSEINITARRDIRSAITPPASRKATCAIALVPST